MTSGRYWLQTLGCPKNQVDSDKLAGQLVADGFSPAERAEDADVLVVNTCAFIEAARQESIDAVLELADARRPGARLVVTGCMAERYGEELARALPEVDSVAGFGSPLLTPHAAPGPGQPQPVTLRVRSSRAALPEQTRVVGGGGFDLLELPRPAATAPWAYVKVAEGCDRSCGFCAIPSFRGPQRSRGAAAILDEVAQLVDVTRSPAVHEIVLVAQDLVSYGRDRRGALDARSSAGPSIARAEPVGRPSPIVSLLREVSDLVARTRVLYLYPSGLTDELVEAILHTGVPYFDLSLQHVSRPLLAKMRRWGEGDRFLRRIEKIRDADPLATFRSSFILGYPGETEEDHDRLLEFLQAAQLDWAGFFPFSPEAGTHAAERPDQVPSGLAMERLRECAELQDSVTARRRDALVGQIREVLVDAPGVARSVHEAPEIDGVVRVPTGLAVGSLVDVRVTAALGTDLVAEPLMVAPFGDLRDLEHRRGRLGVPGTAVSVAR
jgi:ribosomal protein S12 methylthiotransferase